MFASGVANACTYLPLLHPTESERGDFESFKGHCQSLRGRRKEATNSLLEKFKNKFQGGGGRGSFIFWAVNPIRRE